MRREAAAACIGVLACGSALAGGFGLRRDDITLFLVVPLIGTGILALAMLVTPRLWRDLAWAFGIVFGIGGLVFVVLQNSVNNGVFSLLLIGGLFAPWIIFLIFLACFLKGLRRHPPESPSA